ncbi:MAG: hypothetical protein DRO40_10445 [Thermoprotei archaeon]|nr:MAG: hypothetical protein DRO40_10445 [Thermoprotei archaeon]
MSKVIRVRYKKRVLKSLEPLDLTECEKAEIIIRKVPCLIICCSSS